MGWYQRRVHGIGVFGCYKMRAVEYNVYDEVEDRPSNQDGVVSVTGGYQPSGKSERRLSEKCVKGVVAVLLLAAAVAVVAAIFTLHFQFKGTWYQDSAEVDIAVRKLNDTLMQFKDANDENSEKFNIVLRELKDSIRQLNDVNYGKFQDIEENLRHLKESKSKESMILESITNPPSSCNEINRRNGTDKNGIYELQDVEGNLFHTYCDMGTAGGGWTLVASVHENNMKGRCTDGDRWSSEQGNNVNLNGDGFWENRAIHGSPASATSDDYKNYAYFTMNASDVMIWQVPNDTPMPRFESSSFLKYHTTSGFLKRFGGNLASLFTNHYNMKAKQYQCNVDNGPAIPVSWDRGNNEELLTMYYSRVLEEVDAGYIQFRTINWEQSAYALCPGVKIKSGKKNAEHPCVGSTGYNRDVNYCGDFAARDFADQWNLDERLISSAIMIFYR